MPNGFPFCASRNFFAFISVIEDAMLTVPHRVEMHFILKFENIGFRKSCNSPRANNYQHGDAKGIFFDVTKFLKCEIMA